eukprot:Awhi_evm1s128
MTKKKRKTTPLEYLSTLLDRGLKNNVLLQEEAERIKNEVKIQAPDDVHQYRPLVQDAVKRNGTEIEITKKWVLATEVFTNETTSTKSTTDSFSSTNTHVQCQFRRVNGEVYESYYEATQRARDINKNSAKKCKVVDSSKAFLTFQKEDDGDYGDNLSKRFKVNNEAENEDEYEAVTNGKAKSIEELIKLI